MFEFVPAECFNKIINHLFIRENVFQIHIVVRYLITHLMILNVNVLDSFMMLKVFNENYNALIILKDNNVENNRWNIWLIISYKEHIMKMCRQGSNNFFFSINLSYQSKETHFNTLICSKYNSKNKWKTHLFYLLPLFLSFFLFLSFEMNVE